MKFMTKLETIVMNRTGCNRETANLVANDILAEVDKEQKDFEYTLIGVMHSVDKWLDGDELKQDEVNRAATMREKTLQIVESKQAEIERLTEEVAKDILKDVRDLFMRDDRYAALERRVKRKYM